MTYLFVYIPFTIVTYSSVRPFYTAIHLTVPVMNRIKFTRFAP